MRELIRLPVDDRTIDDSGLEDECIDTYQCLETIEQTFGRMLLPTVACLIGADERPEKVDLLFDAIREAKLEVTALCGRQTKLLDARWFEYLAPIPENLCDWRNAGGTLHFDETRGRDRFSTLPKSVSRVSFKISQLKKVWPFDVNPWLLPRRDPRPSLSPVSPAIRQMINDVVRRGWSHLHEADALVDAWYGGEKRFGLGGCGENTNRTIGWLALRRGLQLLAIRARIANGGPTVRGCWFDFIRPNNGADYTRGWHDRIDFDFETAKKEMSDIPDRILGLSFQNSVLERFWPGCLSVDRRGQTPAAPPASRQSKHVREVLDESRIKEVNIVRRAIEEIEGTEKVGRKPVLTVQVLRDIEEAILAGGSIGSLLKLGEERLAKQFAVSRTPIRSAISAIKGHFKQFDTVRND